MVDQVETHVFNQQTEARKWMDKYGCRIESWGPFAEGKNNLFSNPVLTDIGGKYGKTAAQVALRFLLQKPCPPTIRHWGYTWASCSRNPLIRLEKEPIFLKTAALATMLE